MKGVFVNECAENPRYRGDRKYEENRRIIEGLKTEHEVLVHTSLWTVEDAVLNDESRGRIDFIVTNMPFGEMSSRMMRIYTHLPKEEFYEAVYGRSYECLESIARNHSEVTVVVYTGADLEACELAENHAACHVIRRGMQGVDFEIAQIMRILEAKPRNI